MMCLVVGMMMLSACEEQTEHTAPAINDRDSVSTMITNGVNTLISDSGLIKYRIVAERWEINQRRNPQRWIFDKGLFMTQFDEKFHVQLYIQCDTAYHFDGLRLWELRGRVHVLTKDGLDFKSEELFYDMNKHEFYSYKYSKLVTPERTLQGTYFRSDENITNYYVSNSKGSFEKGDIMDEEKETKEKDNKDTTNVTPIRQQAQPQRKVPHV
ncbi:MAG: LPS export ABC transporter periplasmic protein LptC [Prevotella sp.]|nr:LPS export ABC transporter periplasmic protein LptC [Prevotella sp.]MBQ1646135.1 LPS export ABC transporter periplasmic protein LptC [Prevotella sp.]MBQ1666682.1 LPS export ABC transporter periplasmic protein LptC [Prevotella sp.]MBQ1702715.1 LPS export ABC transporter periplasmic protein LptC [Prevotella sp.]MBQ1759839.1 LPS export ABC transporter periplasmic protein LptC [Prevotella sp.]